MDLNDLFTRFDDNAKTWHWIVIIQLILLIPTIQIIYAYLFINHDFDALIGLSAFYVLLYGLMFPFIFKEQIEDMKSIQKLCLEPLTNFHLKLVQFICLLLCMLF
ncbi:hypothetical protein [Methanobrevibacter sp.]|uniref:hypothetical protein n=1 Tax=Methanobrevibacter sp. TaxID=66852 RepID=UPI00386A0E16